MLRTLSTAAWCRWSPLVQRRRMPAPPLLVSGRALAERVMLLSADPAAPARGVLAAVVIAAEDRLVGDGRGNHREGCERPARNPVELVAILAILIRKVVI
jgi:hypothetical protein